jgi:autophagy-related protein 17
MAHPADSPLSSEESLDANPEPPTLDQLVEYFLASKRSLSSISQVWRARENVDAGREAIEENAVLHARNTFVRRAVDVQVGSLLAIRHGARLVESDGQKELEV